MSDDTDWLALYRIALNRGAVQEQALRRVRAWLHGDQSYSLSDMARIVEAALRGEDLP